MTLAPPVDDLFDADRVQGLFDRMARSYDRMNLVMSFGFSSRWRRQLLRLVGDGQPRSVVDLMSGRGETWGEIVRRFPEAELTAIDFSAQMVALSAARNRDLFGERVIVLHEDALSSSVPDASVDVVVSAYGLKTFDDRQSRVLADEIARMLRPGGVFALIDVTMPPHRLLRLAYTSYLRWIVPLAGIVLLSDPAEYRMLHRYLDAYGTGERSVEAFSAHPALRTRVRHHFFGCATSISGTRC
ncbi:class I SAM-dependent methyltransferase [Microbacterium fluvii]|uniref:Class I SAM-dependent methyltransferase n=1 Tax=Microbacterium fluvii TaxID=415215 RepID=A0ABW2H9V6_9MICO|nr:class I SAM-dependent methyltransferase [Microbacterium fluvii]MCU4671259.1 class I SAM-dependent methyltransferase [Microbacterium fluvii]